MKLSRRTNTIILWIVSIGLLVGMVITFTPTLGALTGHGRGQQSEPALFVNEEPITQVEVSQARQSSPMFSMIREGPVAEDLDLLLTDRLIRQEIVRQAAAQQRVGNGEVRDELQAFRERNGVDGSQNDQAYLRLIGRAGYTDQTFRDYLRQQLQTQKWQQEIVSGVEVSDAEVEAYYEVNTDAYQSEPRVEARQIVTEDRALAEELRERVQEGESFEALAREHSTRRAEQGGALGGEEPEPVGRPAFPSAVADAVFGMNGPGLSEIVEVAGAFYLVQVESSIPAESRPLEEVRDQVRQDALEAKQQAAVEERIEALRSDAEVRLAEGSDLALDDAVVARVGQSEIHATDLVRATYTNPQIQQALSPETASLISDFFKPSILEQLVDRRLAVRGASELDATFFGTDAQVAQMALDYVARDAEATEEDIEAYYQNNQDRYTVAASAEVVRGTFEDAEAARDFRTDVLAGTDPMEAASEEAVEDLGEVGPGDLTSELDTALFETDAFEPLPDGERGVSDVLVVERPAPSSDEEGQADPESQDGEEQETPDSDEDTPAQDDAAQDDAGQEESAEGEPAAEEGQDADDEAVAEGDADAAPEQADAPPETIDEYVVLVAARTPERVRPLEEVRADVEQAVLAQERQRLQREWLEGLREDAEVEVLLESASQPRTAPSIEGDQLPGGEEAPETIEEVVPDAGEDAAEDAGEDAGDADGGGSVADPDATPQDAEQDQE
ncbi:MAG: peptidyl-prolyl cis-trans isomerase [Trueperaceae bacterium]|nr:peptidyl-prolyl cis-trans isomerase [Trueperaceae bacterium]